MHKLWMGCAAAVITCTLAAWAPQSTGSSQHLLVKAKSEFAEKARDAAYKRGIVPGVPHHVTAIPTGLLEVPDHAPAQPVDPRNHVEVASEAELSVTPALASNHAVADLAVASVGSDKVVNATGLSVATDAAVTTINASTNEQPESVLPKKVASVVAGIRPLEREAKIVPVSPVARTKTASMKITPYVLHHSAGHKTRRHPEPNASAVRRSMNMLRARAPEIAALIARYM